MKVTVLFLAIRHATLRRKEQIIMILPYSPCHTINILSQKFPENSRGISLGDLIMKPEENGSPIKKQKFFFCWLENDKAFYMTPKSIWPTFLADSHIKKKKIEVEVK